MGELLVSRVKIGVWSLYLLPGLLVVQGVIGVAVGAAAVHNVLRDVLLLLLGEAGGAAGRMLKAIALVMGKVLVVD